MPLFWIESPEDLLKFLIILNKIIKGQYLSKGTQKYGITQNLVIVKSLLLFNQKTQDQGEQINSNHELAIKGIITHFFLPKALQCQKRYLIRGIYKPRDTKIRNFVCTIDKILKYLQKLPPLSLIRSYLNMISPTQQFFLPRDNQKELRIQGFDSATQGLTEIVEFCAHLETPK